MTRQLIVGTAGYLVPNLASAPAAAYRTPAATVVYDLGPRVLLALADGSQIETDRRNFVLSLAEWRTPTSRPARSGQRSIELPPGYEQHELF